MMATTKPSIPDVILELYALGELPADEMKRIDDLIESDENLALRLDALYISNEKILATNQASDFAAAVERKLDLADRPQATDSADWSRGNVRREGGFMNWARRKWYVMAPAVAAAALLLIMIRMNPTSNVTTLPHDPSITNTTRTKSLGAEIHVYRQVGNDIEELANQSLVENHDRLQISYCSLGWPYGVVFSIDGRGAVTLHHPANPNESTALEGQGEVEIPYGYEIDNAPDFERFFLVSAIDPIDVNMVLSRARDFARNPQQARRHNIILGEDFRVDSLTVRKKEIQL
jgi:hypothetical protein